MGPCLDGARLRAGLFALLGISHREWRSTIAIVLSAIIACATPAAAQVASVGQTSRHFVDEHRRNWDETGPRPLETTIWYPAVATGHAVVPADAPFELEAVEPDAPVAAKQAQFPLILISHGTGGCAAALLWMGHYLAAHGYIVAAVNHHGNTCTEKGDPRGFMMWWERPQDLSAVLDRLLKDPQFGSLIDQSKIGALGFSLGGYSVITLAGGRIDRPLFERFCASPARDFTCGPQPEFPEAPALFAKMEISDPVVQEAIRHSGDSYRDPRIRAVFAMAPVFASGFERKDLSDINVPMEILVGAGDTIAPPKTNAERYAALIRGARLIEIPGKAGHYDFVPVCNEIGRKMLPERLCQDDPSVDRRQVHARAQSLALQFFDRTLASHR
ncbi:alpha/beta hydrolase family protein [Bradyrhizobium sp. USDA 4473]